MREFGVLPDRLTDFQPVRIGEHNVEQDQIRPFTTEQVNGASASLGTYERKAFLFQVVFDQCVKIGIILHESYFSQTLTSFRFRVTERALQFGYIPVNSRRRRRSRFEVPDEFSLLRTGRPD